MPVSLTSLKEYFAPKDEAELLALLETYHGSALIVAGGSFVHGLDARGLLLDAWVPGVPGGTSATRSLCASTVSKGTMALLTKAASTSPEASPSLAIN